MKIKKLLYVFSLAALFALSGSFSTALAQGAGGYVDPATGFNTVTGEIVNTSGACAAFDGVRNIICKVHEILNSIIPVLVALGVVYFVWGVVQYVIAGGDEAKKKGRDRIVYGIIGLAIIVGMWGIVNVVVNTFGLGGGTTVSLNDVTNPISDAIDDSSGCLLGKDPKLQGLLGFATCVITVSVIPLVFALAVLMFVWGVVQFVINSSEEVKKEKGRQFMIWGVIALTVMVSVWGLVRILGNTFDIDYAIPQVKSTVPK